jgi:hypothetical protein
VNHCDKTRVVDPDLEIWWIRIRIGTPGPGARKLRNFTGKNALFGYFLKNFTTKKVPV